MPTDLYTAICGCFPVLDGWLPEKQRKRLAQMSPNALQAQYKGLLRRIRTSLLGPLGPLSRAFAENGITQPDDMALLVLLEYHAYRLDLLEAEQRRETDGGM